jgi:hypothetical protein
MNNIVTTDINTNVVVVTSPGPSGPAGPAGPQGNTGTVEANSGFLATPFLNVSGAMSVTGSTAFTGSVVITGSLIVSGSNTFINIGPAIFSGSVDVSGSLAATLFSGSGAGLTNIPASGITGLNLNRIASGSVSASVSPTGKAFNLVKSNNSIFSVDQFGNVSGSGLYISGSTIYIDGPTIRLYGNATLNDAAITTTATTTTDRIQSGTITASVATLGNAFTLQSAGTTLFTVGTDGILSGSGANLFNIPASGIVGLNLSRTATGSVTASVNVGTVNFEIVSGSNTLLSLDFTGKLAVSKSINVGVPTSNNWQSGLQGSYFNNFTPNTDVSEMLRFIAGLLSASAPDAAPNTKTFAGISENITNSGTTAAPSGYVPQSSTAADIIYLTGKGFTSAGNIIFSGKTIYNNASYGISYSSTAGGSSIVSSSADAQLFGLGLLSSGNATPFNVSGTVNWFYSDNNSETVIATSASQNLVSNSSFGTSNGVTIAKINTVNPAVIPPAYQDGKFATVFSSGLFNGGRSFTSVSSSGWYHISASIAIATGSSTYSPLQSVTERIFWAPVSNITIPTQTITFSGVGNTALTATSRSLSGAPYLLTSTFNFGSTVNGVFNPLYTADSTVASMTEADSLVTTSGTASVSTSGGTVQTTTAVFDSTGATARTVGTVPFETDIVKMTGSAAFSAGDSGATNIATAGLGTTSFVLTHAGKNRSGASTTGTQTISYHAAGTFGQPASSGSLAYYGRTSQTYDGGSLTGQTESFTGEAYRIQLNDNVTTFTGNAWDNSFGLYNLGGKDLQVKPGNLVRPGGTYGYWLTDPDNTQEYKYYIRRFQRTSVLTSFTLNVGKTLVAWDDISTNNAVAVGIIFESAKGGASNCRLFDPVYANGSRGTTFSGATVGTNPFTSALDYYGAGGALAGTTYTITVASTTGMVLNGTAGSDEIYVIIRYKGDPSPVTSLTVSGT